MGWREGQCTHYNGTVLPVHSGQEKRLADASPVWIIPISLLTTAGWIGLNLFFLLFPSGQFVSRWTHWLAPVPICYVLLWRLPAQVPLYPANWPFPLAAAGRDLHDGLGPTLGALALKAGSARALFPSDPSVADRLLGELESDIETAVMDIRRLVSALRPPALDELSLGGAIHASVAQYTGGANGD